jgi:hypothetical protein
LRVVGWVPDERRIEALRLAEPVSFRLVGAKEQAEATARALGSLPDVSFRAVQLGPKGGSLTKRAFSRSFPVLPAFHRGRRIAGPRTKSS